MLNQKLVSLISSLKEAYFKTPIDKRFRPGSFTKEYVEKASKEINSISAWFSWENPEVAKEWAENNLPNWENTQDQIKAFEHFTEHFILKCGQDDKYETQQLLYRGCLNFRENPYFMELIEYFDVDEFLLSTEVKSESLMALLVKEYYIVPTEAHLTQKWQHRKDEFANLFLVVKQ